MTETKPSVFTPALETAREDLFKYVQHSCFLVVSHDGYWGRDRSVEEAVGNCLKQEASRQKPATVLFILGDEMAEVSKSGFILRDAGSHNITVIERVRLGALIWKGEGT